METSNHLECLACGKPLTAEQAKQPLLPQICDGCLKVATERLKREIREFDESDNHHL